ncbi:MAG: hypothetical protein WBE90_21140, partial [Xanthobacteraceae bacterium]
PDWGPFATGRWDKPSTKPTQPTYDAPHQGRRQTAIEIAHRRPFAHLRRGRIRHDNTGHDPDIRPQYSARDQHRESGSNPLPDQDIFLIPDP